MQYRQNFANKWLIPGMILLAVGGGCTSEQSPGGNGNGCPGGGSCGGASMTATGGGTPGGGASPNPTGTNEPQAKGGQSGVGGQPTMTCEMGLTACGSECVNVMENGNHCGGCYQSCRGGACSAGVCPTVKDCVAPIEIMSPSVTGFEDYDGATALADWNFVFNAAPGTPGSVYAGPFFYDDATGTPANSMVPGANSSMYALSSSNPMSTDYGGGMGLWMGCIDASAYEGISLWVRGAAPSGKVILSLATEQTSPPAEDDPAGGGTCVASADGDCTAASVELPVTAEWTQLLVPWSSFTGGVAAGGAAAPVDGRNITGMNFNIPLTYSPADRSNPGGDFVAVPGAYDLQVDELGFIELGACEESEALCGVGCVDYQTNHDHCGSCGDACDPSRVCSGGACACPEGFTDCDGTCVNLSADADNCGACGTSCAGPCVGGSCQPSTCAAGSPKRTEECAVGGQIVLGKYWLNNNQWGAEDASGTVCIWDTCDSGNTIGWGMNWDWSGGSPYQVKSFASIVRGWHWGWPIPDSGFPVQLSSDVDVNCDWQYQVNANGTFNVTYDLFTSPSADPGTGNPTDEVMILLRDVAGSEGGLGSFVADLNIGGTSWSLYSGTNNVWNVYQFIRSTDAATGATLNLMDFMRALVERGMMDPDKYLLGVQAGSEVFDGAGQVDTSSFSCTID